MYAVLHDTAVTPMPTALQSNSKLRRTNLNHIPRHRLALRNYTGNPPFSTSKAPS